MDNNNRVGKKISAANRVIGSNHEYVYKGKQTPGVQKVKKRGCGCAGKKAKPS